MQRLGEAPRIWPLVPRYEERGVRRRVLHGYLIFCRIAESRVEVLHVVHGARDWESLFPGG